jgi:MFS family permease
VRVSATLFLRLFLPFALGNFLGSFYRSVNAVLSPDIVAELHLSAEDIGLLTSMFFLVYAGVQIPLGMALDRFGARRVTTVLYLIAGLSALVLAKASDFGIMLIARAAMGLGISVAFMGALKAVVDWVPREKLPFTNSLIMMMGGAGVMGATFPLEYMLHFTDWRGIFYGLAIVTFVIVAAIWVLPPEKPRHPAAQSISPLRGVIQVFTNKEFMRMVPLGSSAQGVNMAMSSLWAGPWLRDVTGLSREAAAAVLFGMATTVTLSALSIGSIGAFLMRFGIPLTRTSSCGIAGFILFETLILLNVPVSPWLLWIPYAFCATAPTLVYSVFAEAFPPHMAGRVNTAYNFTTFSFAFLVQWFMGAVIDLWPPIAEGQFAPAGYRWGLGVIVSVQLCAFTWMSLAPRIQARRTAKASAQTQTPTSQ